MRTALKISTLNALVFIAMLSISGMLSGALSDIAYYLAFLLPVGITFAYKSRTGMPFTVIKPRFKKKDALLFLPTVFPVIALIFAFSYLTSLILTLAGAENSNPDVSGDIYRAIFSYAVLPALLEELLFRFVIIGVILPHSKRGAIIFSALFFSLAHCNLFQIPYAFLAGILFALIDVYSESILPSVILHLINNVTSVLWLRGFNNPEFKTVFVLILFGVALVSSVCLFALRHSYKTRLVEITKKEDKLFLPPEVVVFLVVALILSISII